MNQSRSGRVGRSWRTWSAMARCEPVYLLPSTCEGEVVDAVRIAAQRNLPVRAAGTGHSFNPLACTDGVLIDQRRFAGVVDVDHDARTVTVKPGTTLGYLGTVLDRADLALDNIGSLADQTIAGAVSTGNHGSGITHQPLSSQLTRLRLVTADGEVVRISDKGPDPDLWRSVGLSLGALGIVTELTLRCVPKFNLKVVEGREPLGALLDRVKEWAHSADHVQLNWIPWTDAVATRSLHRTAEPITPGARFRSYRTTAQEARSGLIGLAGQARPSAVRALTGRFSGSGAYAAPYVSASHDAFMFPQPVKFLAMEHALPLPNLAPALRELRGALRRIGRYSPYTVLVRVGAADDVLLSPAYGRATAYINVTVPRASGYQVILRTAEHVLRELEGRPHWGKAHTATADIIAPRYPEWALFQTVRARLDPTGVFSNDYVCSVLGSIRTLVDGI